MAGAVMRPLNRAERMQTRWIDGRPTREVVADFIKPNNRLTSFERLEIYNRQYWFRLVDCFFSDFPGLRAVLGDRPFLKLTLAYLDRHPSTTFTLRDLGRNLIDFIAREPHWTRPRTAPALDMARLEWAYIEAFDKVAKPALRMDELLGREPADIPLRLQPNITLLALDHPFDHFLISLRQDAGLRGEASNAVASLRRASHLNAIPPSGQKPVLLAVHRYRNRVFYKRLRPAQHELLIALQAGASLENALQAVTKTARPEQIKAWFKDWTVLGWFWLES